ncbi:MAG: phage head closure protein [Phycisphaerales bacterium]|nr:phage head closure protein [Phycisphaerales bacterium]
MIGKLNKRVTLQSQVTTQDDHGTESTTWSDVLTCWAWVRPVSGRELLAAQQPQVVHDTRIRIRFPAGIAVGAKMRVNFGGRLYDIVGVVDLEERHIWLELLCLQGASKG